MPAAAGDGAVGHERDDPREQEQKHPRVDPIPLEAKFEEDTADHDGDQRKQAKTPADDRATRRRTIDEHEVEQELAACHQEGRGRISVDMIVVKQFRFGPKTHC